MAHAKTIQRGAKVIGGKKMKKLLLLASTVVMGLLLVTVTETRAFCLVFCDDSDSAEVAEVEISEGSSVTDSSVSSGGGNTTAANLSNTVVIGGDVVTTQSNYIGGIGVNKGDITQNNSANITGRQGVRGNDMRDFSRGRER